MSRNIGSTTCDFCNGKVLIEEASRPIRQEEAGVYYPEYAGMLVANAHCEDCEATYLAWVNEHTRVSERYRGWYRDLCDGETHVDLSFRSSFNDEPGRDDLPRYRIRVVRERGPEIPLCVTCGTRMWHREDWCNQNHGMCVHIDANGNGTPEEPPR
jgi:hypothetical protein